MNTTICMVRHGVTDWNYAGRVQGRSDVPLAPEGERQAEAVAFRLAGEAWDAIYSSPLKRAYQTARAIARRAGLQQVIAEPGLIERNMGEAEGMPDIDLPMLWPDVAWDDIPGMEPADSLVARTRAALAEMAGRHPGGRIICVAHSSLISRFLKSLAPQGGVTFPRPTAFAVVRHDGKDFTLQHGPDHLHLVLDGVEYTGEKGRVSGRELAELLPTLSAGVALLEQVIWRATSVESAWSEDRLVGFARAFTDGLLYGCIDVAVALPGYEHVLPVLTSRLEAKYPDVRFTTHKNPPAV